MTIIAASTHFSPYAKYTFKFITLIPTFIMIYDISNFTPCISFKEGKFMLCNAQALKAVQDYKASFPGGIPETLRTFQYLSIEFASVSLATYVLDRSLKLLEVVASTYIEEENYLLKIWDDFAFKCMTSKNGFVKPDLESLYKPTLKEFIFNEIIECTFAVPNSIQSGLYSTLEIFFEIGEFLYDNYGS